MISAVVLSSKYLVGGVQPEPISIYFISDDLIREDFQLCNLLGCFSVVLSRC